MENANVGFAGAGQMARALAKGVVDAGVFAPNRVFASDTSGAAISEFCAFVPGSVAQDNNLELAKSCSVIVVAVKPPVVSQVAAEIRDGIGRDHLVISIAAGIRLEVLCRLLGTQRVARVMPNTPCMIGAGASAYTLGGETSPDDAKLVERIVSAVGLALLLPESLFDAATGLSGSGPAYVFAFIEAMIEGGLLAGLPLAASRELAVQTVLGSAQLLAESGKTPAELRLQVTSPGGTTIAGLKALEEHRFRSAVIEAVCRAAQRSRQLAEG